MSDAIGQFNKNNLDIKSMFNNFFNSSDPFAEVDKFNDKLAKEHVKGTKELKTTIISNNNYGDIKQLALSVGKSINAFKIFDSVNRYSSTKLTPIMVTNENYVSFAFADSEFKSDFSQEMRKTLTGSIEAEGKVMHVGVIASCNFKLPSTLAEFKMDLGKKINLDRNYKKNTNLENNEFNKLFEPYVSDQVQGRVLLNSYVMEHFVNMHKINPLKNFGLYLNGLNFAIWFESNGKFLTPDIRNSKAITLKKLINALTHDVLSDAYNAHTCCEYFNSLPFFDAASTQKTIVEKNY